MDNQILKRLLSETYGVSNNDLPTIYNVATNLIKSDVVAKIGFNKEITFNTTQKVKARETVLTY